MGNVLSTLMVLRVKVANEKKSMNAIIYAIKNEYSVLRHFY